MSAAVDRPVSLVVDDQGLVEACERWAVAGPIGVDTEFVRERTYYPRPGLIQVADRSGDVRLVDPLGISDFAPLADVLTDRSITKLMHAHDEDLDVLQLLTGVVPEGLFDTQLAGAFVGHGFSASYAGLVESRLGVVLDKGLTRSDWLQRPLQPAQLHYAAQDVRHLGGLHDRLARELAALGRREWFEEEQTHRRRAWVRSRQPETAYTRIRRRGALSSEQHGVLRALTQWREMEAMARDIPRRHVLPDEVLVALATEPTVDLATLNDVNGLSPRALARYGPAIVACVDAARATGPDEADHRVNLRPHSATLTRLKDLVGQAAVRCALPAELIASRRTLEALLVCVLANAHDIPPEFQGWRAGVITPALLDCIG